MIPPNPDWDKKMHKEAEMRKNFKERVGRTPASGADCATRCQKDTWCLQLKEGLAS